MSHSSQTAEVLNQSTELNAISTPVSQNDNNGESDQLRALLLSFNNFTDYFKRCLGRLPSCSDNSLLQAWKDADVSAPPITA